MKLEGALNKFLSGEFKKYKPDLHAYKTADKYQVGIPDFILWLGGSSVVIECKNTLELKATNMLSHEFSPTQLNNLKSIAKTGSQAYGLVAIHEEKLMWLIPADKIPKNGNVTSELLNLTNGCEMFSTNKIGVASMVDYFIRRAKSG